MLFTLPWLFGFLCFFLYPLLYSLVLAFSTITDLKNFKFVFAGTANFVQALTNDMEFLPALYSSLLDLIDVPIVIIFSLIMAILLNKKFRGRGFYRVIFILPLLLGSSVVMSAIQGNHAGVQTTIHTAGQTAQAVSNSFKDLLLDRQIQTLFGVKLSGYIGAIVNRISNVAWVSSIQIVIFLGALQTVPDSLYEAADIDGASEFEKLWKITLPLMLPSIELNLVFSVISHFTSADNQVMKYISQVSFKSLMLSYGSAMAWMYFLIVAVILWAVFAFTRHIGKKYQ